MGNGSFSISIQAERMTPAHLPYPDANFGNAETFHVNLLLAPQRACPPPAAVE